MLIVRCQRSSSTVQFLLLHLTSKPSGASHFVLPSIVCTLASWLTLQASRLW
jgi:hypothetical protein